MPSDVFFVVVVKVVVGLVWVSSGATRLATRTAATPRAVALLFALNERELLWQRIPGEALVAVEVGHLVLVDTVEVCTWHGCGHDSGRPGVCATLAHVIDV